MAFGWWRKVCTSLKIANASLHTYSLEMIILWLSFLEFNSPLFQCTFSMNCAVFLWTLITLWRDWCEWSNIEALPLILILQSALSSNESPGDHNSKEFWKRPLWLNSSNHLYHYWAMNSLRLHSWFNSREPRTKLVFDCTWNFELKQCSSYTSS